MRTLEILLLFLNLPFAVVLFTGRPGKRPAWRIGLTLLALLTSLVSLAHLWIEGGRWQLVPAYALTATNLVFGLRLLRPGTGESQEQKRGTGRGARFAGGLLATLALATSAAVGYLFPIPQLPALTGPFRVGTAVLHLVDPSRAELYSPEPGGLRELMVQVWYPAGREPGQAPGPWMAEAGIAGPAIARRLDLPVFLFNHLQLARTNAIPEAKIATGGGNYPVLLFSHGWGGLRTQNVTQVEELASHGYVVAAVDHTYGAVVTVFPDGRVALWNPSILPFGAPPDEFDRAANQLVETWAGDLSFMLDQLDALSPGEAPGGLSGRLDMDRVGVLGHSTGGGATVVFCDQDPRCRAGLAMDAWLEPVPRPVIEAGLGQPFLFMRSAAWEQPSQNPENDELQAEVLARLDGAGYRMAIEGTGHFDFSALPLFSPLAPALGLKGPIDGYRVNQIINAYTLAFFNQHLRDQPDPLLAGPDAAYPEVTIQIKP